MMMGSSAFYLQPLLDLGKVVAGWFLVQGRGLVRSELEPLDYVLIQSIMSVCDVCPRMTRQI